MIKRPKLPGYGPVKLTITIDLVGEQRSWVATALRDEAYRIRAGIDPKKLEHPSVSNELQRADFLMGLSYRIHS